MLNPEQAGRGLTWQRVECGWKSAVKVKGENEVHKADLFKTDAATGSIALANL